MDGKRFDRLVQEWSATGTRRGLLRFLAGLPLVVSLAALLGEATAAGRRRRKARRRHHSRKDNVQHRRRGRGKDKGKDKEKKGKKNGALTCTNAGRRAKNGKRCCSGLVRDGSGLCVHPPSPPDSTPSSCATTCSGCCARETCVTATSAQQCGSSGAQCASCAACQHCDGAGLCVADSGQDGACCPAGVCQSGSCVAGSCTPTPCGPATCPNGCCATGTCQIDVNTACGPSCTVCALQGQVCQNGHCVCTATSCQGGCCDGTTCLAPGQQDDIHCGTGVGACINCTAQNLECSGGQCVCVAITCPDNACGEIDDECGGTVDCDSCADPTQACIDNRCRACTTTMQCPAHHLCVSGECQACTIFCEDPDGCDGLVQAAIDPPNINSTIYICPGTYNGMITIDRPLTLIGAGSGNTILNANLDEEEFGGTVTIGEGINVTLRTMRITGGRRMGNGGGIYNDAGTLTLTDCTVSMNTALGSNAIGRGGGIFNDNDGTVLMTSCSVLDNTASGRGGGIFTNLGTVTLTNSSVMGNTATGDHVTPGQGGGIYNDLGAVTLDNSTVDENFASEEENNCAPVNTIDGCSG